jgi:hypothetical protein
MALNWLALGLMLLVFGGAALLTVLALVSITMLSAFRVAAIWANANDPWAALDVLALTGLAWAARLVWFGGWAS